MHWQRPHRLIEGGVRPNKSEHGLRSSTARHSTSTQMQRHEPSRKTLAAFACVTPASLLTLQPPDNFAIDAMDHAGEVCVGGLGVAVADDGVAIGEWVGIGIGHRGHNVSPPGRRGLRPPWRA